MHWRQKLRNNYGSVWEVRCFNSRQNSHSVSRWKVLQEVEISSKGLISCSFWPIMGAMENQLSAWSENQIPPKMASRNITFSAVSGGATIPESGRGLFTIEKQSWCLRLTLASFFCRGPKNPPPSLFLWDRRVSDQCGTLQKKQLRLWFRGGDSRWPILTSRFRRKRTLIGTKKAQIPH